MIASLPEPLLHAIDSELAAHDRTAIRNAADALSQSYRGLQGIAGTLSPIDRAAYLAVRFPSTFASCRAVWEQAAQVVDLTAVQTVLDAGAGPGTASLAAMVPPGTRFTQLERDQGWRKPAGNLARAMGIDAHFHAGALPGPIELHDVVIAAYALNELPGSALRETIAALWAAARQTLLIIEPGTPKGFAVIETARIEGLAAGGHAAAPCTHDDACPMRKPDWCHQPVRVERSAHHRAAKHGALAYEDEKFSYVVLTRAAPRRLAPARIVRKPIRNAGHVHLDLCTEGTMQRVTVARSDKGLYHDARDASWGDTWPAIDHTGG
jgi:ribosomal protein RSM22 (predicted rRNA methylase)